MTSKAMPGLSTTLTQMTGIEIPLICGAMYPVQ